MSNTSSRSTGTKPWAESAGAGQGPAAGPPARLSGGRSVGCRAALDSRVGLGCRAAARVHEHGAGDDGGEEGKAVEEGERVPAPVRCAPGSPAPRLTLVGCPPLRLHIVHRPYVQLGRAAVLERRRQLSAALHTPAPVAAESAGAQSGCRARASGARRVCRMALAGWLRVHAAQRERRRWAGRPARIVHAGLGCPRGGRNGRPPAPSLPPAQPPASFQPAPGLPALKDWYRTKMSPSSVKQNSRRGKKEGSLCGCLLSAEGRQRTARVNGPSEAAKHRAALCLFCARRQPAAARTVSVCQPLGHLLGGEEASCGSKGEGFDEGRIGRGRGRQPLRAGGGGALTVVQLHHVLDAHAGEVGARGARCSKQGQERVREDAVRSCMK